MGIALIGIFIIIYAIGRAICNKIDEWIEYKYRNNEESKTKLWISVILYLIPYIALIILFFNIGSLQWD